MAPLGPKLLYAESSSAQQVRTETRRACEPTPEKRALRMRIDARRNRLFGQWRTQCLSVQATQQRFQRAGSEPAKDARI